MKKMKKVPMFISLLLFLQLVFPIIGAFAAEAQAPTNLIGYERYPGNVVLEWGAVTSSSGYKVYRIDGETKTLVTSVTTNKAYLSLKEGTYTYAVSAMVSGQESPLSNQVTLTIVYPDMQAPGNLKASIARYYDLTLSWDAASYVHYYKVYQTVNGVRKLVTTTEKPTIAFTSLPEGHYVYEVTSYNSIFGESALGARIEVDIVYPEMLPPTNLTYKITNGNDITFNWQASTNANKYNIYKVENGQRSLVSSTTNLSATLTNVPEGNYVYEVTSYSYAFKESKTASQIDVILVHPDMLIPGNLQLAITNGNDGTLSWNPVNYATSYKVYQIINGSKVLLNQTNYNQLSFPNMEEGNYIYEVTSYSDRFGESAPVRLEQQVIYPEMQSPSQFEGFVLNVDTLYLKWNKADYATYYKLYQIIDGERKLVSDINNTYTTLNNLPEGNYVYEITSVSDRFGESKLASRVDAQIIYPTIEAPQNLKGYGNPEAKTIALWWDEVEYATSYDVYQVVGEERTLLQTTPNTRLVFFDMEYGAYTYEVVAHSKYGDSPASNQTTVYLEPVLEAPTDTKAAFSGDDLILNWKPVTGAQSYNVYEVVNGERILQENTEDTSLTLGDLESGDYTFIVVPVSASGEESPTYSTVIVGEEQFDTTAPVTVSNAEDSWLWLQGPISVQLSATDDQSGVAKTFYSINGSEYVEGTSFTVDQEGINKVSFYSVDNAGNSEAAKNIEVKVDKTAPVTTSDANENWSKDNVTIQLTATDDQSGVAKTFYSINGSEYVEGSSFTISEEGINKVSFYSIDNAGNIEEAKTIEVKVDKTAPVTTSDAAENWYKDNVTIQLTATDDLSGVAKTYYSINGAEYVEGTTFTISEEGINKVSFYSIDNAGNIEEAKTIEVKVDKTAPVTTSDATDNWNKADVTIQLTATDDLSGVAKTYYSINGSEYVEGTSLTISEEGINKVSFYSVDNAGNIEEAKTIEVKLDKTAPAVSWDLADKYALGSQLPSFTANDESGIASAIVTLNGEEVSGPISLDKPGTYTVVLTVTDNAGLTTTIEKTVSVSVQATIKVNPGIIKGNKGVFTVQVILPNGVSTEGFDLSSATLNGVSANTGTNGLVQQAKNGQFKFNRENFDWNPGTVEVVFQGYLNGYLIEGSTTVVVK